MPVYKNPKIFPNGTFIQDENGNEQIKFATTASAVNEFTATNAATSNNPNLSTTGGDTDIGLDLTPKGAGKVRVVAPSHAYNDEAGAFHLALTGTTTKRLAFGWDSSLDSSNGAAWIQAVENGTATRKLLLQPVGSNVGIGLTNPTEILHISKTTGNFTTIRFDSGSTQGYFFAYDGDTSVNIGSNSNASVNIRVNNTTVATFNGGNLLLNQATLGSSVLTLQSTATNDDPVENVYQNRVATTDATVTTLHTFTVPSSTTYMIEAKVIARRTGGASGVAEDGAGYVIRGTYKNVAGTATLIGAVNADYTAESQAGWDATFDTTGATVRCRVTGASGNNVTWHMTARVCQVST